MNTPEEIVRSVQSNLDTAFPGAYTVSAQAGEGDDLKCLVVSTADHGERGALFALGANVLEQGGAAAAAQRLSDQILRVVQDGLPGRRAGAYIGYDAT